MTPLERAARGIHTISRRMGGSAAQWPWEDPDRQAMRDDYAKLARAVLAAIREPSEAMLKAVDACSYGQPSIAYMIEEQNADSGRLMTEVWQAMIDAALEEGA